jgi:hypothetical protein
VLSEWKPCISVSTEALFASRDAFEESLDWILLTAGSIGGTTGAGAVVVVVVVVVVGATTGVVLDFLVMSQTPAIIMSTTMTIPMVLPFEDEFCICMIMTA